MASIDTENLIIPMAEKHAEEVAELHYIHTKSLIQELGRRMCIIFYKNALKSKNNFGYVYVENSRVMGFIFGTVDNSKIFNNARILIEICLGLIRKPHLIKEIIFRLKGTETGAPEGLYSAVDQNCREKGTGIKLYKALNQGFMERGINYFESRIDADNKAALILRKMLGASIKEEFYEHNKKRYRLVTEIRGSQVNHYKLERCK
ncbi:MAG: hypothetical protein JSV83_00420 [Desulfobacterales bacterium]|nr:MAG: hypothetical protein JSV83_00420 [Desulfobacterales bacterium]